ncbi:hypothetical protein CLHOM_15350 [Clostridium homopropionicum DSM 5847]|uniref:Uncharacterized protein n=1 Tax=Clostridium homopropionicum DSM 5847 TaxID=1121318 RepID=A0A0L6ZAG9_9CLOT|nr:hypothetical protein [Clostridium homopropionicum]KOA19970.1 hypothetical protein CLHOM_15350 [Clostridium homopropionicum DSM 5847]SFG63594.1 hypothetical protein SAMN04488501_1128 [Clostridium homopropionicum]
MKKKKIISMVLAAGLTVGGTGFLPVKALAATNDKVQVINAVVSQKDLKQQSYDLLNKIKENPTEADIKAARKMISGISDLRYTSAYIYLLNLYVDKNIDKGISPIDELLNASAKNQSITSMEQKFGLNTSLLAENLSEEEQMAMAQILPIINTLSFGMDSKMKTSDENKKIQIEGTIDISVMNMPVEAKMWIDMDITGATPKMKYIIEIPNSIKMFLPAEFKDKQYLVYDMETILKASGANGAQMAGFGDIMKSAEVFNKKFTASFNDFIKIADGKYDLVSRGDLATLDKETAQEVSKLYKIDLNNEKLLGIVNDALKDYSMKKVIKNYINDSMKLDPTIKGQEMTDKDFEEGIGEITKALGQLGDSLRLDMTLECGVNKEGYISYQKGSLKVTVDSAKLNALNAAENQKQNAANTKAASSKYTFTLNFDSKLSNINKEIKLAPMPEVNEQNSIDIMQLLIASSSVQPGM